jgi:hypothetical protein
VLPAKHHHDLLEDVQFPLYWQQAGHFRLVELHQPEIEFRAVCAFVFDQRDPGVVYGVKRYRQTTSYSPF